MADVITTKFYGNYRVLDDAGELIFCCDNKKINWYLSRNLAKMVSNDTIQLLFKPKGRGHIGQDYFLKAKNNVCVVCNSKDKLTRHHIVPICYRKHFPDVYKNRCCYDIMLLCKDCHNKYESYAWEFKKLIAKEHKVLMLNDVDLSNQEKLSRKACSYSWNYLNNDKIPEDRKIILLDFLKTYLKNDNPKQEDLIALASYKKKKVDVVTFSKKVVDSLNGDVISFIKKWREHFISNMNPQYLPEGYDVHAYLEK